MKTLSAAVVGSLLLLTAAGCARRAVVQGRADYRLSPGTVPDPVRPVDPPAVLTEAYAVRLAWARDPRMEAAQADLEVAKARRQAAGARRNPEFRGGPGWERGVEGTETGYGVALRLFPAHPRHARAQRDRAGAEVEAAWIRRDAVSREIALEVGETWARLQEVEEDLASLAELTALRALGHRLLREQAALGRSTLADVAQAAAAWMEASQESDKGERGRERLRRRLRAHTGLARIPPLPPADDLVPEAPVPDFSEGAVAEAVASRPEVQEQVWRLRAARAHGEQERAAARFWPSHVQAAFSDMDQPGPQESWSLQVAVDLPIFAVGRTRIRVAEAERRSAEARFRLTLEKADAEIREAWAVRDEALAGYHRARDAGLPLIEEMRRTLEGIDDRSGVERLAELRLQETVLNAERALMKLRFDVRRAERALASALSSAEDAAKAYPSDG